MWEPFNRPANLKPSSWRWGVSTCGKHYHLAEFQSPFLYAVRMFAVNIVRIVGWGIIVIAAIPSVVYLLALLYLAVTDPFSPGIGLVATLTIAATFLISSAAGALLVSFSQVVLSLQSIERSLQRIENGPLDPRGSNPPSRGPRDTEQYLRRMRGDGPIVAPLDEAFRKT